MREAREGGGWGRDLFTCHLAMPLGWVESPAYFKIHTDALSAMRNRVRHGEDIMSGNGKFNRFMYVGDCMVIECPMGR